MANTSLPQFITTLDGILDYNGGTGSVNLYMAHGGTNFGYSAGAQRAAPTAFDQPPPLLFWQAYSKAGTKLIECRAERSWR